MSIGSAARAFALATVVVCAVPATALSARPPDTFSGTCTGLEGWASWDQPLRPVPVDMVLRARVGGGQCSGTLNGREVDSLPAVARATLRGPQSCGVAATSGRFTFTLAGRRISGEMTYRRIGSRVTALWEGDRGGSAVFVGHAQIGVVAEDDPAASTPIVGPVIADDVGTEEALRRCADEGISRQPVRVDQIATTPALSG